MLAKTKVITPIQTLQLLQLNELLASVEDFMLRLVDLSPVEPHNTFYNKPCQYADYNKQAIIRFGIDASDDDYHEDGDNELTTRLISLRHKQPLWGDKQDHTAELIELRDIGISPICMLFHDLYSHAYGPQQKALTLGELLRISCISIDVIKTDHYQVKFELPRVAN
jgi:hypothetical protein